MAKTKKKQSEQPKPPTLTERVKAIELDRKQEKCKHKYLSIGIGHKGYIDYDAQCVVCKKKFTEKGVWETRVIKRVVKRIRKFFIKE